MALQGRNASHWGDQESSAAEGGLPLKLLAGIGLLYSGRGEFLEAEQMHDIVSAARQELTRRSAV